MAGKFALIIGNSRYEDSGLSRLSAPDLDVQGLEEVLKAPDIGGFDQVTTLLNEGCASVRKAVARFYDQRQRDDLLFLYFSGHGVKDEQGHLYLALRDTESKLLAGTAIETAFITGRMDRSFSKRQVLVLDCCHSGAFAHGAKAAQGASVGTAGAFEGTGLGRVILTATDSTQYAWEGDQIIGDAQNSLFTHFLIEGLKTGAADRDEDGAVTVDELYDYVHEHVLNTTPRQTPNKWTYRPEGEIVLAQNPFVKPSALPPEIEEALNSKMLSLRLEAVRDLETLLRGHHAGRARAALAALKSLSLDDSRKVAQAAAEALKTHDQENRRSVAGPPLPPAGEEKAIDAGPPATPGDRISHSSDIFISYAHEDRDKARALANVLVARGWKVWWDRKIAPGEAFDEVIERELGTCKCAIVLWSARSVNATWVRNEARRAARRKVLVPILIDRVETPLEFENLQAADLTSWKAAGDHPEFEAVLDRIQALSPIQDEHLARSAVEDARREFAAGRRQPALASLEAFRPSHALVTRALAELRGQAERIERDRVESVRREGDAADQQRAIVAEQTRIEGLLVRLDLDAAERALAIAERTFERAEFSPLRERLDILRRQAKHEQLARAAVEEARQAFADGRRQAALRSLEQFHPPHHLVIRAVTELRAEAERIERERAEATRREAAAARRHREIGAVTAQIEDFIRRLELDAADLALSTSEKRLEYPADLRSLRERVDALRAKAQRDQLARNAVADARREFGAGRTQAAIAGLEQFHPAHDLVSAALTELRTEAGRIERERVEAARREAELAHRRQALAIEKARTEDEPILEPRTALRPLVERYDATLQLAPLAARAAAESHLRTPARSMFRPALIAVAGLLALIVGTWLAGVWPGRFPRGPRDLRQPPARVAERPPAAPSPTVRTPSVEQASASGRAESPAPETTPAEIGAPVPDPPTGVTVVPDRPDESPAARQAGRLDQLRTQARALRQAGQREQALNAIVQGLQIVPRDSALRTMRDSMLTEARGGAALSRSDALALDADELAGEAFGQGRARESAAERLRRTGRIEDATRSFWMASDQFKAAAAEAKRIAREEEEEEKAATEASAGKPAPPVAAPPPPIQPEREKLNVALEITAGNQMLRQYEAAYARRSPSAVRSVYPSAPLDQLEKEFAGVTAYTLKVEIDDSNWKIVSSASQLMATATGRVTYAFVRSNVVTELVRTQTFYLEKPGKTWIIKDIQTR